MSETNLKARGDRHLHHNRKKRSPRLKNSNPLRLCAQAHAENQVLILRIAS